MSAEKNEAIEEVAATIYQLLQDERIRQKYLDIEKNEMERLFFENRLKKLNQLTEESKKLTEESKKLTEEIKQKEETIEKMAKRIAELEANQKK